MLWFMKPNEYQPWTKSMVLPVAFVVRVTLILYSAIHGHIFNVDFTDIDYHVFSDAVKHVASGNSPFDRATYRYTPALAWMLYPNIYWANFGKYFFCACDILVGWFLFELMTNTSASAETNSKKEMKVDSASQSDSSIIPVVLFWLANPLTAIISARGNADVIVCITVLLTLYLLKKDKFVLAAVVHGALAVHFKIYPVIYLPSIFVHLSGYHQVSGVQNKLLALFKNLRGYIFAALSLLSFWLTIIFFYNIYGNQFLEEFLLYHIKRRDIRHNFSPYFLPLYLVQDDEFVSKCIGLLAFMPQLLSIVVFAFRFSSDLPFCWFLTTFAFVTFNKVCTSQYFIWYIVLIPLIVQKIEMSRTDVLKLIGGWFAGQGLWLFFAYLFEFKGCPVFIDMVFYLIGLGLGDVEDISVKGLNAVKKCARVYLEAYTSILCYGLEKEALEKFYGREVIEADRTMVEQSSDEILNGADTADVAMLVVGDPFGATTHSDLVIRAKEKNIPVKVIHNVSIMNAVGCCGLQLYNFGETVSICMWIDGFQPDSYYDKIAANRQRGLHTLCLLDIKTKEQSVENLIRGRKIYEPPRYMTCAEAADQLLKIGERKKDAGLEPVYAEDTPCVGLARVGWDDQKIMFCSLREMTETDMGPPLHSLIIPGKMHEVETEFLEKFRP